MSSNNSLPVDSPLWTIQPEARPKYEAQFRKLSPQGDYASGESIKQLMMMSGLPAMVLAKIWSLSDVDVDGKMDLNEFSVALHLIAIKMKGFDLPDQLPPALMNLVKQQSFSSYGKHDQNNSSNNSINRGMSQSASASSNISQRSATTPTSSTVLPASGGALGEWAIPPLIRRKYTQLFNQHDRNRLGHLTGLQAKGILMETKLPQTTLATLWNLSDVDADGKLSCDEFVLCMFLVDKAKNNEILPLKLPPELIPPSYRRSGSISGTLSHHSSIDDSTMDDQGGKSSFEDKRRENYEKGQAELDRRRQAIMEQEKRAKEERERKEREEAMRKEKIRLEEERRKQEEIERAQQLARQKQLELDEQKRRAQEVRDLARREMERQRQQEVEKQRRTELMNARSRLAEEVQKLKARRKQIGLEHEKVDKQIIEGKTNCKISRDRIVRVKSEIDAMRNKRDDIIAKQNAIKNQIKALTDQTLCIEQEKVRLSTQVKTLFANAGNGTTDEQASTFDSMLQAKRLAINQLKAHIERYEQEGIQKQHDLTSSRRELDELRRQFETKRIEARSYADLIESKRQDAEAVRDGRGLGTTNDADVWTAKVPSNFEWPANSTIKTDNTETTPKPNEATSTQTKFKYRCVFAYEARNADEITINPGDIVMVNTSAASEPDWLSGEINGKVGWFPAAYAELVDENSTDANAHVTNPEDAFTLVSKALSATEHTNGGNISKEGIVLYDYNTTEEGYLELKKGDKVRLISEDGAWCFGDLLDDSGNVKVSGWFPNDYLNFNIDNEAISNTTNIVTDDIKVNENCDYYLALYAFDSQQDGDLEFAVDEIIKVEKRDGEWWTGVIVDRNSGTLNDSRRGVFPSNFVTPAPANVIPGQKADEAPKSSTPEPGQVKAHLKLDRKESEGITSSPKPKKGKAKKLEIVTAIAAYTASSSEQLSLEIGQLIQVRKKMDSGWWEGELQAKGKKKQVGWFPASYVKPLGSTAPSISSAGITPEPPKAGVSVADEVELERVVAFYAFKAGREDELTIETNDIIRVLNKPDPTWWRGHNIRTDAVGLFPSNHVQTQTKTTDENHPYYSPPVDEYYYEVPQEDILESDDVSQSKSISMDLNTIENDQISTESFDSESDSYEHYENDDETVNTDERDSAISSQETPECVKFEQIKLEQTTEKLRKFGEIFFEILQTEKLYVDSLQFTIDHFRKSMLEDSRIVHVPRDEIELYFSQIDSVLKTNKQFYRELDDILSHGIGIALVFELIENHFRKMLPVYETYCYDQGKSIRKLQSRIENDKIFKTYLEELETKSGTGLPLSSFLLKPMQRITKYPLFISRFLKVVDRSNRDFSIIERVFLFSQTLCKEINEKCKMLEMLDMFGWLETHVNISYKNCDQIIHFRSETQFMGTRTLLFSGILNKLPSNKHLIIFLFNDFLLFTTPSKRTSKLKSLTPNSNFFNSCPESLFELQYDAYRKPYLLDDVSIVDQKSDFETNWHQHLFRLMIHTSKRQIVLSTSSVGDCDLWIKAIQKAKTAFCDSKRLFLDQTVPKKQITSKPQCILFITIIEGNNFFTNNFALNASCKVSISNDSKIIRFSEMTKVSRVELSKSAKSFDRRSTGNGNSLGSAKSLNNLAMSEQNLKVHWNEAFRIFIEPSDKFLKIECYDQNTFSHSQSLGEWHDSLECLGTGEGFTSQPKTKTIELRSVNYYNITPNVLIKYTFLPISSR